MTEDDTPDDFDLTSNSPNLNDAGLSAGSEDSFDNRATDLITGSETFVPADGEDSETSGSSPGVFFGGEAKPLDESVFHTEVNEPDPEEISSVSVDTAFADAHDIDVAEVKNAVQKTVDEGKLRFVLDIQRELIDKNVDDVHQELCERIESLLFRPGKVGVFYEATAALFDYPIDTHGIQKIDFATFGFEEYGLKCTLELDGTIRIAGNPLKKYDDNLNFVVHAVYDVHEHETHKKFLFKKTVLMDRGLQTIPETSIKRPFVINPDPWTLWENHEPDASEPYQKLSSAWDSGHVVSEPGKTRLAVVAASMRGRSHAHVGAFRDDDFSIRLGEYYGDWSYFAIADGAGSAKYSREDARVACETAVEQLKQLLENSEEGKAALAKLQEQILDKRRRGALIGAPELEPESAGLAKALYAVPYEIFNRLSAEAEEMKATVRDYSTTLHCAAIRRLPETELTPPMWLVLTYGVGDGGIVVDQPNGREEVVTLTTPDSGEYAGQTRFVTMRDQVAPEAVVDRVRAAVFQNFNALVMMTDGVADPFFPADNDLKSYARWQEFWSDDVPKHFPNILSKALEPADRAMALEEGLNFRVEGNHDDRTMVILFGKAAPVDELPAIEE